MKKYGIVIALLCFFAGIVLNKDISVLAMTCCNGTHDDSCYESGVAKHVHTNYTGRPSKSQTEKISGGCFTDFHKGGIKSGECKGTFSYCGDGLISSESEYTCSCRYNEEYLRNGGVGIENTRETGNVSCDDGYMITFTGKCTRCGATAYMHLRYVHNYSCSQCTLVTTSPGPHTFRISESAHFEIACGKSADKYYYENGNGDEAFPVCGKTVIQIVPDASTQKCTLKNGSVSPVKTATVYFKDGHSEKVTCVLSGLDTKKYNEWQTVKLKYGEFSMKEGELHPQRKSAEISIKIYIIGYVNIKLSSVNIKMGQPVFENGMTEGNFTVGEKIKIYASPNEGYIVEKWTTDEKKEIIETYGEDVIFTVPSQDLEIICSYKPLEFIVTFDASGGMFSDGKKKKTTSVRFGELYGLAEVPLKEGFCFYGWKYGEDNNEKIISMENDSVKIPKNHTLTAVWVETGPDEIWLLYDDYLLNLYTPTMRGYEFEGWYMAERECNDGTGMLITDGLPVKYSYNYNDDIIQKTKDDYVIFAGWKARRYKVTFECGANTYISSGEKIKGSGGKASTYHVIKKNDFYDSDRMVKTVTFDMPYSNMPFPVRIDNNEVIKDDLVFIGWSTGNTVEGLIREDMIVNIDHDITVYPIFAEIKTINVYLDTNGGQMNRAFSDGTVSNPFKAETGRIYGNTLGYLPEYEGHLFRGWCTEKNGQGLIMNTTSRVVTSTDHTLYAKWEYYVNYNANDIDIYGNMLPERFTGVTVRNVFVNDDKTNQYIHKNGFLRNGYIFVGWNTRKNGTGTWYCNESDISEKTPTEAKKTIGKYLKKSVTLYAQWESCKDIIIDMRGGENKNGCQEKITTYTGQTIPENLNGVPQKAGFEFYGFYTGIKGTGARIYDETGTYCYDDTGQILYNGRVAIIPGNSVMTGEIKESSCMADSVVMWTDIDRLYAYWKPLDDTNESINYEVTFSNPYYDAYSSIPSSETLTTFLSYPKYVICSSEGQNEKWFDISVATQIRYTDPDTEETKIVSLAGTGMPENDVFIPSSENIHVYKSGSIRCVLVNSGVILYEINSGDFEKSLSSTDESGLFTEVFSGNIDDLLKLLEDIEFRKEMESVKKISCTKNMNRKAPNLDYFPDVHLYIPKSAAGRIKLNLSLKQNTIKVHTPVAVTGKIVKEEKSETGHDDRVSTGESFSLFVGHSAQHIYEKGYGKTDYSMTKGGYALSDGTYAVFPFDVYVLNDNNKRLVKKGTHIDIESVETRFFIPDYVEAGDYTVKIYEPAVNNIGKTYDDTGVTQNNANTSRSKYIAVSEIHIRIIGKIITAKVLEINNEPVKEYMDGLPVIRKGNKLDFFVELDGDYSPDEITVYALLSFRTDDEMLHLFSTVSDSDVIKTFVELGKDIYSPLSYDGKYAKYDNGTLFFECPFTLPYLTYPVTDSRIEEMNKYSSVNTVSGKELFFAVDKKAYMELKIYAVDKYGNTLYTDEKIILVILLETK